MYLLITKDENNVVYAAIDSETDLEGMGEFADGSTARTHDFTVKYEKKNGKWQKQGESKPTAPKAKAAKTKD